MILYPQVSKLQFLDEHQQALQQYTMEVRIEERASGNEYIASVHPSVLEEVLGELPCSCNTLSVVVTDGSAQDVQEEHLDRPVLTVWECS